MDVDDYLYTVKLTGDGKKVAKGYVIEILMFEYDVDIHKAAKIIDESLNGGKDFPGTRNFDDTVRLVDTLLDLGAECEVTAWNKDGSLYVDEEGPFVIDGLELLKAINY